MSSLKTRTKVRVCAFTINFNYKNTTKSFSRILISFYRLHITKFSLLLNKNKQVKRYTKKSIKYKPISNSCYQSRPFHRITANRRYNNSTGCVTITQFKKQLFGFNKV